MSNITEPIKLFYKSDFKVHIKSDAGWGLPFRITFWSGNNRIRNYIAQFDGETFVNCHLVDANTLCVAFDDHGLGIGQLYEQTTYTFHDDCFPSGTDDEALQPREVEATDPETGELRKVILDLSGETALDLVYALPMLAAEQERQENERQRIADENIRQQQEQQRELITATVLQHMDEQDQTYQRNEQSRAAAEAQRASTFNALKTAFDKWYADTKAAWDAFINAKNEAWTAFLNGKTSAWTAWFNDIKAAWKTFNDAAATAEQNRKDAETARATAEQNRKNAEETRQRQEQTREQVTALALTKIAENDRLYQQNEQQRATAEAARNTAEQNRKTAETARVTAESNRTSTFNTLKATIEKWFSDIKASWKIFTDSATEAEAAREKAASDQRKAEAQTFTESQAQRSSAFTTEQTNRSTAFATEQKSRSDDFKSEQTSRATAFTQSEAQRTSTFDTNEQRREQVIATSLALLDEKDAAYAQHAEQREVVMATALASFDERLNAAGK